MVVFVIIGAIAGILLGLRFKVFVLVPAILLAAVAIVVSSHGLMVIALTVGGTVASLQIGYVVGCVVRVVAREHLPARSRHHGNRRRPGDSDSRSLTYPA